VLWNSQTRIGPFAPLPPFPEAPPETMQPPDPAPPYRPPPFPSAVALLIGLPPPPQMLEPP